MSDTPTDQATDLTPQTSEATGSVDQQSEPVAEAPPIDYLDIDDDLANKHVRVKVDGEELSVPLSEALQGYSRQADYSRKTQEVARQREEAANALQLQRALLANPGMTMQILANQAGMSIHDFLGLSPAQQQAAVNAAGEEEYVDPLERGLAEERRAREALEERILQREADDLLMRAVAGLKQQFQIDDTQAKQVVAAAYEMGLPPQAFPMIYRSMAYQQQQAQGQVRQEVAATQEQLDQQRRAAAVAAGQVIGSGASANGVQGTPVNQEFKNYRDAIMAAFEQHGDVA